MWVERMWMSLLAMSTSPTDAAVWTAEVERRWELYRVRARTTRLAGRSKAEIIRSVYRDVAAGLL